MTDESPIAGRHSQSKIATALVGVALLLLALVYKFSHAVSPVWAAPLVTAVTVACLIPVSAFTILLATRLLALSRYTIVLFLPCIIVAATMAANLTAIVAGNLFVVLLDHPPILERTHDQWTVLIQLKQVLSVVRFWFASAYFLSAYLWLRSTPHTITRRIVMALFCLCALGFLVGTWYNGA